jgi:hypothetical protein
MTEEDRHLLESRGWVMECASPFEIRRLNDLESFATRDAAAAVLDSLRSDLWRYEQTLTWLNIPFRKREEKGETFITTTSELDMMDVGITMVFDLMGATSRLYAEAL